MPRDLSNDPFDSPRDTVTLWEHSLRPSGPSGWLAGGSAVLCALAVVWLATRPYAPSKVAARPEVTTAAPASPDGHPKLLHLWPVKLLQAGRSDYDDSGVMAMRAAASFRR